jgi:TRAP-type C4-dicarboxylate transport system permease small subunit
MIDQVLRGVRALLAVLRTAAAILLAASVAINFANIIGRYVFSVSIPWAEEAMLFLMTACVFSGAGLVSWQNRHIRMDVVIGMLPPKAREAMDLLADLVFLVVAALLVDYAWPVITELASFDQRSQAANFPLYIPQATIPIGLTIMAALVVVRLLTRRGAGVRR